MTVRETPSTTSAVAVWDPVVRFGHWALVLAFAIAYFSAEEEKDGPDALHVWSGYVVAGIVILRVLWGFVGSQHARFSDFVRPPADALRYLGGLARGRAPRYLGHSPAGAAMAIALLTLLAATTLTGLIAYGELGRGPLASLGGPVAPAPAGTAQSGPASADQRARLKESAIGEIHETLANITLALIGLHVVGVIGASIAHRENLIAAMITGRKRAEN
ncbi:cytochrome b/b6 domain-containing protein [Methylocapsa polymorpha]|uniref:Cytochrome b/b6 domain-containing protein n=1 Tax=Methylocapsa polymorpha TaxID=3080828 RepID=A0ABZ0HTU8_9HYPH|nr:cytochrome b/b6 domain-containing protein [Methylocapsa sp. RX1]